MKKYLLLFFLLAQTLESTATHIIGGQLNYEYMGRGDWYKVTLTVFRDCYRGIPDFDQPASIGLFDATTNKLIKEILVTTPDTIRIPLVLTDPCLVIPPEECVQRAIYVDSIELPFNPNGYILAYQRCCRNNSIANIVMPDMTGATYSCTISAQALTLRNNSAVFKNFPDPYICNNRAINFDHAARDKDGDRLVYKLCMPQEGASPSDPAPQPPGQPPYLPVVWRTPYYSLSNVMGGVPLAVNARTGLLTGTPNTIGQFVVGVCVEEYRNNVLISTSRRDFQYNVGKCDRKYRPAFFNPDVYCDGLTVKLNNKTLGDVTNYVWDFGVRGITTDTSTLFSPTYTFPDTGCYIIKLVAQPNDPCKGTFSDTLCLRDASIYADFKLKYKSCNDTLRLEYIDESRDTLFRVAAWHWTWTGGGYSTLQNPEIIFPNSGTYTINLEVTSTNGCKKMLTKTVDLKKFSGTKERTIRLCKGKSVALNPTGNPDLQYAWQPAATLDDATKPNPIATPTVNTTYQTTFVSYNLDTCRFTQKVNLDINNFPPLLDAKATRKKIFKGSNTEIFLEPILSGNTYTWQPNAFLTNTTDVRQMIAPTQSTVLVAQAIDNYGCLVTDTLRIEVIEPTCGSDYVFLPNAFSPNDDKENDVLYVRSPLTTDIYLVIYNRWGEKMFETSDIKVGWDGTYQGKTLAPDVYGYFLRIKCLNNEAYEQKGNVTLLR